MSINTQNTNVVNKLEIMLEAARRATWDALNGPKYLRFGCFNPPMNFPKSIEEKPIEETTERKVTPSERKYYKETQHNNAGGDRFLFRLTD